MIGGATTSAGFAGQVVIKTKISRSIAVLAPVVVNFNPVVGVGYDFGGLVAVPKVIRWVRSVGPRTLRQPVLRYVPRRSARVPKCCRVARRRSASKGARGADPSPAPPYASARALDGSPAKAAFKVPSSGAIIIASLDETTNKTYAQCWCSDGDGRLERNVVIGFELHGPGAAEARGVLAQAGSRDRGRVPRAVARSPA
jgi:hypothetical protein